MSAAGHLVLEVEFNEGPPLEILFLPGNNFTIGRALRAEFDLCRGCTNSLLSGLENRGYNGKSRAGNGTCDSGGGEIIEGNPSFMHRAIALATQNVLSHDGGPFGAVVVRDGKIIATGTNLVTSTNDPTAHAEVVAIARGMPYVGRLSTHRMRGLL